MLSVNKRLLNSASVFNRSSRRFLSSTSIAYNHNHDTTPEENLLSNPNYLYAFGGLSILLVLGGLDSQYASNHSESFFGSLFKTRDDKEIVIENVKLQESVNENKKVAEVMFLKKPSNNGIRNLSGLTNNFKKSGFPFNYAPGDHYDVKTLGERKQVKSLFNA